MKIAIGVKYVLYSGDIIEIIGKTVSTRDNKVRWVAKRIDLDFITMDYLEDGTNTYFPNYSIASEIKPPIKNTLIISIDEENDGINIINNAGIVVSNAYLVHLEYEERKGLTAKIEKV